MKSDTIRFPALYLVRQGFETTPGIDVAQMVGSELERTGLLRTLIFGDKVLMTAGSRGVECMAEVLSTLAGAVKQSGANPLILPAMGSHGGGTAEGQADVLRHLGLTEKTLGAPIHKGLEPMEVGRVRGSPVYADRAAVDANHIILVNRIKEHTEFIGEIESGLIKMCVVGMGRIAGAEVMHRLAVQLSYEAAILEISRVLFETLPIRGGVAILEDKNNAVRRIEVVPAAEVFAREPELLAEARQHHARLPFDTLDVLLVDEIGKDISGAGFDTKVIGRIMNIYERECERPTITRIVLRDLSEKTGGNAIGLGLADYIHRRVVEKMDGETTAINSITAVAPEKGRVPIALPSDRETLDAAFRSIGSWNPDAVRMAWIVNTAELQALAVSPALADEARAKGLEVSRAPFALPFDGTGELPGLRRFMAERGLWGCADMMNPDACV